MENLTGGTPPVRYLPCVVPCKLYFAEGEAIGFAKGEAEEKLATAKRLLSIGLSVQDVAKGTSLSVEQVEKIKAELA
ncbi:hypothetical protein [Phascolarctobacterium succinatutens]|uniref:hypothetical protein n=1 Tax=Phascolarctobacterium succinatutens TaxID=626940 RepID=UPI00402644DF